MSEVQDQNGPSAQAGPTSGLPALLAELRRRRVFRVLVGYGLFSFAVLQVVEPVLHAYHLPDWTLTAVVTALGLGFPLALVLSWAYDLTAEGVKRTPASSGPGTYTLSRGRLAALLLGAGLLAALPGVAWYAWSRGKEPPPTLVVEATPSVGVLPFVNMSGDPENEYFSDGLSEEILNALAQVPGLRVPARTSSFAFKGKQQEVPRIAEALHVAHILEGSVRKANGRVRITAQLIKAADGFHLWSQTFERPLTDVWAVQEEISSAIAGALKLQLATGTNGAPGTSRKGGTTSNTAAYEEYLQGRHQLNDRTRPAIEQALAHFQKAVALDPGFAVAWADLAIANLLLSRDNYGEVAPWQAISRARPLLEKALALTPEHPEVLAAAGLLERSAIKPEKALAYLDRSLAINPSNAEALNWRRGALESMGRYDQLLEAAAAATHADPIYPVWLTNYVSELFRFGKPAEAAAAQERLRALGEDWWHFSLGTFASERADHVEVVRQLVPALQQGRTLAGPILAGSLAELGLVAEALQVPGRNPYGIRMLLGDLRAAEALALAATRDDAGDPYARLDLVFAWYAAGRSDEAVELLEQNMRQIGLVDLSPDALPVLAYVARAAHRPELAARYRERAVLLIDRVAAAGARRDIVDFYRARLAAYDGRDDEAVRLLQPALTATGTNWGHADLSMPLFSRLLRRADYQAALKGLDARLAAQRAQVVALLCGPKRLSETWQPAPETCAGAAPSR